MLTPGWLRRGYFGHGAGSTPSTHFKCYRRSDPSPLPSGGRGVHQGERLPRARRERSGYGKEPHGAGLRERGSREVDADPHRVPRLRGDELVPRGEEVGQGCGDPRHRRHGDTDAEAQGRHLRHVVVAPPHAVLGDPRAQAEVHHRGRVLPRRNPHQHTRRCPQYRRHFSRRARSVAGRFRDARVKARHLRYG